jgi:hypothetical protein
MDEDILVLLIAGPTPCSCDNNVPWPTAQRQSACYSHTGVYHDQSNCLDDGLPGIELEELRRAQTVQRKSRRQHDLIDSPSVA